MLGTTLRRTLVLSSSCLLLAAVRAQEAPTVEVGGVTYGWDVRWSRPGGSDLGNTHGCLVVDRRGHVYANTDTEHAVVVFAPDGRTLRRWGKEFHGGLHGMCLVAAGERETLWLAHTRRHEVVQVTLDGEVLRTIGWPEASGIYEHEGQYHPTAVAVAPDGRLFVADGYGKSWIHAYDRDGRYLKSFGGPGSEPGKLATPHGLWLDARGEQPLLLVADRENHRLQWFSLDGEFVRLFDQELRRPCNVWPLPEGGLVVADLVGRISFFDAEQRLLGHVGDNPDPKLRAQNGVPRDRWRDGEFLSPHSVCVDAGGHVYVMDWNAHGRISRLERWTPLPRPTAPRAR
jgi:hypothetical protein